MMAKIKDLYYRVTRSVFEADYFAQLRPARNFGQSPHTWIRHCVTCCTHEWCDASSNRPIHYQKMEAVGAVLFRESRDRRVASVHKKVQNLFLKRG